MSYIKAIVLGLALAAAFILIGGAHATMDTYTGVVQQVSDNVINIGMAANHTLANTDLYAGLHVSKEVAFPTNAVMDVNGVYHTVFIAPETTHNGYLN